MPRTFPSATIAVLRLSFCLFATVFTHKNPRFTQHYLHSKKCCVSFPAQSTIFCFCHIKKWPYLVLLICKILCKAHQYLLQCTITTLRNDCIFYKRNIKFYRHLAQYYNARTDPQLQKSPSMLLDRLIQLGIDAQVIYLPPKL